MSQFDESKVKRADDGRFAEKPPAPEAEGVDLEGAAEITSKWGDPDAPEQSEQDKGRPGAVIATERPADAARDHFVSEGYTPEDVDEAFSLMKPKRRYDDQGEPYDSYTNSHMERVEDILTHPEPGESWRKSWNADCRECGNQIEDEGSPNIKGSCLRCSGDWELEDEGDYEIAEGSRLGSYVRAEAVAAWGEEAVADADEAYLTEDRKRSNWNDDTDHELTAEETEDYFRMARLKVHGTDPQLSAGSRTPWGSAQQVEFPAQGVAVVHTEGHGGIKLSPERNKAIAPALRNASGWYEEDSESHIVAMYHPDAFGHRNDGNWNDTRASAEASVRDWYPDQYEKATGVKLRPEQSYMLRQSQAAQDVEGFRAAHANDYVTNGGDRHLDDIDGMNMRAITVERRATGDERVLVAPQTFWRDNGTDRTDTPIVVNPDRMVDITDLEKAKDDQLRPAPRPKVHDLGIDYSNLTEKQSERARGELDKRYRYEDGQVATLADRMASKGVEGKSRSYFSGEKQATYYVELGDSRIQPVSKSTYDALGGVPETMSETDKARFEMHRAEQAAERNGSQARREALTAARTSYRTLSDRDSERTQAVLDDYRERVAQRVRESGLFSQEG